MKKIFILSLFTLMLFGSGCGSNAASSLMEKQNQNSVQIQTYHNQTYSFSFAYLAKFSFVSPTHVRLKDGVVQLQSPRKTAAGTLEDD